MTNQDEVAIQRAVERALVNVYLGPNLRGDDRNESIKRINEGINTRTDFTPLTFTFTNEIAVKDKIKGENIRLNYDRPTPSASSHHEPSKSHPTPSLSPGLSRSDILAICGVLLQLATAILLFALLVRQ